MSKYKIQYSYNTGDSFTNEDNLEDEIELTWDNLEVAKANLQRINEHYQYYQKLDKSLSDKELNKILEELSHKDWAVVEINVPSKEIDIGTIKYQLILYTDEGKPYRFPPAWCGYFESLNYAEIITKDVTTRIEFD